MNLSYKSMLENEMLLFSDSLKDCKAKTNIVFGILIQLLMECILICMSILHSEHFNISSDRLLVLSRSEVGSNHLKKAYGNTKINIASDLGIYKPLSRYLPIKQLFGMSKDVFIDAVKMTKSLYHDNEVPPKFYRYYLFRLVHFSFYYHSLECIIKCFNIDKMVSCQITDRFAFAEYDLAKRFRMERICIPHGLEPLEKLPHGFPASVFYCHSEAARDYLTKMYGGYSYIYSEELMAKLMDFHKLKGNPKKIVFFTQPHSEELNNITIIYLKALKEYMDRNNYYEKLYIKFHPSDKKENYHECINNFEVITDYADAISSSICISYYSTCLLEALYNNSYSISIMEKGMKVPMCEVMLNPKIHKIDSTNKLLKLLDDIASEYKDE